MKFVVDKCGLFELVHYKSCYPRSYGSGTQGSCPSKILSFSTHLIYWADDSIDSSLTHINRKESNVYKLMTSLETLLFQHDLKQSINPMIQSQKSSHYPMLISSPEESLFLQNINLLYSLSRVHICLFFYCIQSPNTHFTY